MIATETVAAIANKVLSTGTSEQTLSLLRGEFPGIHFTYCMDDDVFGPKPVYETETFNLYLVDGRDHCLTFTNDPSVATGMVVAEVVED